ncbi:MAG: lactaldehyde reductase [Christensenellales bacterium]
MYHKLALGPISYHGRGAVQAIAPEVLGRSLSMALVVADPALYQAGLVRKVIEALTAAGIEHAPFDAFTPNPTVDEAQAGVQAFKEARADHIIAIGGGSTIDIAKAIGIMIANPEFEDFRALEGAPATKHHAVFTIAVPTTAGTAAEVTVNYVLTDPEKRRKFVCVDPHSLPAVAVVDPDLMDSMPPDLCAATGMDALTHAVEGYITKGAWTIPDVLHLNAIKLIAASLPRAVSGDPAARERMALAQYAAGMGFSNVGLGIVHSMAHSLGAWYDTAHGIANAILLPTVMAFNAPATGEKYRHIACAMGVPDTGSMSQETYRRAAVDAVRALSDTIGIPRDLKAIAKREDADALTESAFLDACRPGNPRETTKDDIKKLFLSLL